MNTIVYGSDKYKKYFASAIKTKIHRTLKITKVNQGVVFPCGRPYDIGVYDENCKYVPASDVMEFPGKHKKYMPWAKQIDYIDEDVLYLGDMHWHFGHFLLEHLGRLWPILNKNFSKMKCVIMHKSIMEDNNDSYIYELLKLFGIKRNQLIVVKRPTRFKNVFVPETADNYNYTSREFNKIFDRFIENTNKEKTVKKISKVYVSREKMDDRRTFGEKYISKIFSANGFNVIYPEKLSLLRQIQIISNCDVLAGCAGTALHLALFMKKGGTVIQLKRNRKNKDNCSAQNHINSMRGLNGVFIDASLEIYKTDHYTSFPQLVGLTPYLKQFFIDNAFKFDTQANDTSEYCEYIESVKNYRKLHGNAFVRKLKRLIVKISACFVPGRERRGNYRRWLKSKLNYEG